MHVRVFRVVVGSRHPFERRSEILLHPSTRSRVSRFKSALSPNSGETINFQRRSSPAFCQPSSRCRDVS